MNGHMDTSSPVVLEAPAHLPLLSDLYPRVPLGLLRHPAGAATNITHRFAIPVGESVWCGVCVCSKVCGVCVWSEVCGVRCVEGVCGVRCVECVCGVRWCSGVWRWCSGVWR